MGLYTRVKLCRDLGTARAHVKYIAFRSRETPMEQRGAFDARSDHADVNRFNENLDSRLTRHPMANKAYKLHISLSEREFRQLGMTSWKPIIREAMANLQQKWGRQFDWIASEHMAKGHPHVHIVIKATCVDEYGRARQLRLDKEHLLDLKQEVGRIIERDRGREMDRPREQERSVSRSMSLADTLFSAVESFLKAMEQYDRETEAEVEREVQRRRKRPERDERGR